LDPALPLRGRHPRQAVSATIPQHSEPRHTMALYCHHWECNPLTVLRGTFVEFRNGMINVSPIGRGCS
jgi:hypothetical protein